MVSNVPKDIMERKKYENKIENLLGVVERQLKELELELKAQKRKKNKYKNTENKEEVVKLLNERYSLITNKLDGLPIQEKQIEDNRTNMEKLDELLKNREGREVPEREIYQEEQDKIDEWNKRVQAQDQELEEIHKNVKMLKNEAKLAGEGIDEIGRKVKKVDKHADKTSATLNTQNKKLKDLLNKIRTSDRFCIDLVLFLILLGLGAVLYSIIKKKWF